MKKLLFFLLAGIVASTVFLSCKDKFNEESFLRLQAKLKRAADSALQAQKAAQAAAVVSAANTATAAAVSAQVTAAAAALNAAGQLLALTVQVQEDRAPLAGVLVSLANTSGATATASATTDANGNAVFTNAVIGVVTATITKTGYATAEAVINLGTVTNGTNYTSVNTTNSLGATVSQIVPIKQSVAAVIPIFATTGASSTATLKGNVQIETDLTNTTFEIPQGLTLIAGFSGAAGTVPAGTFSATGNGGGAGASAYNFAGGSNGGFGVAAVNTTSGAYSMTIPASSIGAGLAIAVTAPVISANQTMWVNSVGTSVIPTTLTRLKLTTIPAIFDPTIGLGGLSSVPQVDPATITFNAPPPAGAGFTLAATAIARTLPTYLGVNYSVFGGTNEVTVTTDRGSYGNTPPAVTVGASSPAGSTPATAGPQMNFRLTALTASAGSTLYANPTTATVNYITASGTTAVNAFDIATAAGALPTTITIPANGNASFGFTSEGLSTLKTTDAGNGGVTGFSVTIPAPGVGGVVATLTPTFSSSVNGVIIAPGNAKYTNANPPSFGFTTGTANFKVLEFLTQWTLVPTSAATTPFVVLPTSITYSFAATSYTAAVGANNAVNANLAGGATTSYEWIDDPATGGTAGVLTTDGTNLVSSLPAATTFSTATYNANAPTTKVNTITPVTAVGDITGNVAGVNGELTAITITNNGAGYAAAPVAAIVIPTGGPGTGAVAPVVLGSVGLVTKLFTPTTGATPYNISISPVANQGTKYWANLNRQPSTQGSFSAAINAKPGQVYIVNIKYGTGTRPDNVYN